MDQKPTIFIDSNYWIYLFDKTTAEHELVKKHFNNLFDEAILAVNTVVMMEVMHYLVKRLGSEIAKEKWGLFSSIDFVVGNLEFEDLDLIFSTLCKYLHTGIGGRDATILSFLEMNQIQKICTHDNTFTKIPNLEIIDPIA
ncbi:MAG: type II toxin-antitoxin system VapC family toxin [Promethearchaeota archaeon]